MARSARTLFVPRLGNPRESQYGSRWSKVSKQGLSSQPVCEDCLGPAQCRHHEQPLSYSLERMYDMDWHVSLCLECHAERHKRCYVTDWDPNPVRHVLWGLPATGKTTALLMLKADLAWDMDDLARERGWQPTRMTPSQIIAMQRARDAWVSAAAKSRASCALICTSPQTAYECGRRLHATMHHVWCHEHVRQRRLRQRKGERHGRRDRDRQR